MGGPESATIYDVARLAGVSSSTVSHVLNGTRKVSEETRRRVQAAVKELGYRPNDAARMLREGRAKLIGLVVPDISNTFFAGLAHSLEMLAYDRGARLVTCNSDYERERERAYVDDLVRRRVDGIIIAPIMPDAEFEAAVGETGLPVVLIDRVSEQSNLPNVGLDNGAAAALAAEHLYQLGHRRIGCISNHPDLADSVDQRVQGFTAALKRHGVAVPADAVAYADFRVEGGMAAAGRLLASRPDLTAIFCTNDPLAVGAIKAAVAAGRSVPGNLSVIGFDDSLEAQIAQPPLTTVAQPIGTLAGRAMDLLRGDEAAGRRQRLSARLIVRQSTGPVATPGAAVEAPALRIVGSPRAARAAADGRKRILIAGAGRIGRVHGRAVGQLDGAVIAGFCDPDQARASALAKEFATRAFGDAEEALSRGDVDGIIIGSSSDTHLTMVRLAARHGVHVFCEKPLALTQADIMQAIDACAAAKLVLQVGFNRRFDPNVAEIAAAVRAGKIGKPLQLRIVGRDPAPPPRDFLRRSGGMFHDMSIHDFDLARHLVGEEVIEVMVAAGCLIDPMFAEEGDVDVATMLLRFASGAVGVIDNARATPYGYDQRIELLGTAGALESENQTAHRVIFRSPAGQAAPVALPFFLERYETAFRRQMESFVALIASPEPREPVVSGIDALRAHQIADAARESLRTGLPAKIASSAPPAKRKAEKLHG
ncbi:MAG TPA: substrate-binding domain-containing protein [Dongiaceae bacterium]